MVLQVGKKCIFMNNIQYQLVMKKIIVLLLCLVTINSWAQDDDVNLGVIPAPVSIKKARSEFSITPETTLLVDSPNHKAVKFLVDYFKAKGYSISVVDMNTIDRKSVATKNVIIMTAEGSDKTPMEGYSLHISGEQIKIVGKGSGLFYGVETLLQLIKPKTPGYATVHGADIDDYPRFQYRGMHLDVARHFFGVDFIKQYLDLMAAYKLNNFHWHLTDDQGWRIEIKKYPKLTSVGSFRDQTKLGGFSGNDSDLFDNTPYSGFYTQEQVKEIVEYAADRFINVVPEIEMPGHSMAAIASYPEMSCDPKKDYKVGETWGVYKDVYCPSETTFKMLDNILEEVMDMFPGKYIHIGGDECPKEAWMQSDFCRQLVQDSSLTDGNGLQSYFIRTIERFVNSRGRTIIGWDEILDGGLAPNATVMSWRGEKGGIAAARQKHNVIMTPGTDGLYFDHAQSKSAQEPLSIGGLAPYEKTYAYDPIPAGLSDEAAKHIIGVQANVWTEYIATPAKVEYMIFPRMFSLAEIAWTPKENKDIHEFSRDRVPHHLAMLDAAGIDYRVPETIGIKDSTIRGDKFDITLTPSVEGAKVYYTLDGSNPRETDLLYSDPLRIIVPANRKMELKTIVITPSGKRSNITDLVMVNKK